MNATVKSLIFWVIAHRRRRRDLELTPPTFERIERGTGRGGASLPHAQGAGRWDPEAKLKELGIALPTPGAPIANYVNAVQTGNLLFLAGKGTAAAGRQGRRRAARQGHDRSTRATRRRAPSPSAHLAVLKQELGDLKRVTRIVKVLGMVNSDPGVHPAAGRRQRLFRPDGRGVRRKGKHARSAVGMATTPGRHPGRGGSDRRDRPDSVVESRAVG